MISNDYTSYDRYEWIYESFIVIDFFRIIDYKSIYESFIRNYDCQILQVKVTFTSYDCYESPKIVTIVFTNRFRNSIRKA